MLKTCPQLKIHMKVSNLGPTSDRFVSTCLFGRKMTQIMHQKEPQIPFLPQILGKSHTIISNLICVWLLYILGLIQWYKSLLVIMKI